MGSKSSGFCLSQKILLTCKRQKQISNMLDLRDYRKRQRSFDFDPARCGFLSWMTEIFVKSSSFATKLFVFRAKNLCLSRQKSLSFATKIFRDKNIRPSRQKSAVCAKSLLFSRRKSAVCARPQRDGFLYLLW